MNYEITHTTTTEDIKSDLLVHILKQGDNFEFIFDDDFQFYYYLPALIVMGHIELVKMYPYSNKKYMFHLRSKVMFAGFRNHMLVNDSDRYRNNVEGARWERLPGTDHYVHIFRQDDLWGLMVTIETPLFGLLWEVTAKKIGTEECCD